MIAEIIKIFKEIENVRSCVARLAEKCAEIEKEKECFFKELIRKEQECESLKGECARLRSLCRIKDKIIKEGVR